MKINKLIPTIAVLVYRDNEILLVKNNERSEHLSGMYCLPAGRIEGKEKEIEAAERESLKKRLV